MTDNSLPIADKKPLQKRYYATIDIYTILILRILEIRFTNRILHSDPRQLGDNQRQIPQNQGFAGFFIFQKNSSGYVTARRSVRGSTFRAEPRRVRRGISRVRNREADRVFRGSWFCGNRGYRHCHGCRGA